MSCKILNFPNLSDKNLNFPIFSLNSNFPNVARQQDMEFSKSCNFLIAVNVAICESRRV